MVSARDTVKSYIDKNPVMVFSKSYCPYCDATKKLLAKKKAELGFSYKVVELDKMGEEGAAMQDALEEEYGQRSVPNIFIMQKHIGGNSHIQKCWDLDEILLKAAEASESGSSSE